MTNQDLYRKLQEMLPDYVFGQLSQEDNDFFLLHHRDFPDLIEEVDQAKAVFGKLEKMEIQKVVSDRTRNLSVKVNQRRNSTMSEKQRRTRFFMKYLAPMASLALVALFMFTDTGRSFLMPNIAEKSAQSDSISDLPIEFVNYSDLLAVSVDGNMDNLIEAVAESETIVETEDASLSDYIEQSIESAIANASTNLLLNSVGNYSAIQDDLSMLSEDDFQSIIEDLENEIDF